MPHPSQNDETQPVAFGDETIALGEKQARVDDVFHHVAGKYDVMNDLMSGGLHRAWKNILVTMANPSSVKNLTHIDVAGGTGDIALRVQKKAGALAHTTLVDVNAAMLGVGKTRVSEAGLDDKITLVQGNAEALAFPDKSFDLYTIAFGIRNVPRIEKALAEAKRVLKTGGHFLCLEFSHVDVPLLSSLYAAYSDHVIPRLGQMIAGDAQPYAYLKESIRRFPDQDSFSKMLKAAGLERVSCRTLAGGIAAIHSGWRL